MGVAPVDGYGNITAGNAKEIYSEWRKGNIELSTSQQKYVQGLLSPEDKDEVDYDTEVRQNDAASTIPDAEKADEHSGQAGNVAGNSIGMAYGGVMVVSNIKKAMSASRATGWVAVIVAAITAAQGILCLSCANAFDSGYGDRTGARDNADGTNATIDGYNQALVDTMDAMNEDMANYEEGSNNLALNVNENISAAANLQVELAAAQAAGDKAGVERIKAEIQALNGADFSKEKEELETIGGNLEEYSANNAESVAVSDAGQTVSDFLKEGTPLGVVAGVEAALLAIGSAMCLLCVGSSAIGGAKDASHFDFGGLAASVAACALYLVAMGTLGKSALTMSDKAKNELDCGSAGRDMQDHVNDLNGMIEEQAAYTETTAESFGASDEAAAEMNAEATEAAGEVVENNKPEGGADIGPEIKKPEPVVTPTPTPTA